MDWSVVENVHTFEEDRVGEAKSWNKVNNAAKKEERWKIVPACSWWQLVDSEEGKEQKMLWRQIENLLEFKMNCLALYYFWYNKKLIAQAEDIFDVLDRV